MPLFSESEDSIFGPLDYYKANWKEELRILLTPVGTWEYYKANWKEELYILLFR